MKLTDHMDKVQKVIDDKAAAGNYDAVAQERLSRELDMTLPEWAHIKRQRHMVVTALGEDEADMFDAALGYCGPASFNRKDLALKVTITELAKQLLEIKVGALGGGL